MSDSCKCFDIEVEVILDEPEFDGELDFDGEVITCSDGEDYKRGYEEGHAQGLVDGQKDGYQRGYDEGHEVGSESGYSQGKQDGLTEGYDNGYEKGKSDGYKDGYEQGYSEGYTKGYENGKAEGGEFIGIKYLEVTDDKYKLPVVVDARSLSVQANQSISSSDYHLAYLFANASVGWYMGQYAKMKDVYLPDNLNQIAQTMFFHCGSLENIYGDLTNVTVVNYQSFYSCESLTKLPYMPNLEKLAGQSFRNCIGLTSVAFYKVLTSWDTSAFQGCTNIETINLVDGWNTSIYAQHCPKLTSECVDNMISCLADMTGQNAPTIQFHADVKAKLPEEQIATITGKNWTLA